MNFTYSKRELFRGDKYSNLEAFVFIIQKITLLKTEILRIPQLMNSFVKLISRVLFRVEYCVRCETWQPKL